MATTRTIKPRSSRNSKKKKTFLGFLPENIQVFIARRIMDIFAAVFILCGGFLVVSLLSYDNTDPSGSTAADAAGHVSNWGGHTGAWIADIFAQSIGIGGFILAAGLLTWGVRFFRRTGVSFLPLRIISILAASVLAAVAFAQIPAGQWLVHPYMGSTSGSLILENIFSLTQIPRGVISLISGAMAAACFVLAGAFTRDDIAFVLTGVKTIMASVVFAIADTAGRFVEWVVHYNDADYKPKPRRRKPAKTVRRASVDSDDDDDGDEDENSVYDEADEEEEDEESFPSGLTARKPNAGGQMNIPVVSASKSPAKGTIKAQQQFLYDGEWTLPDPSLLQDTPPDTGNEKLDENALRRNAELLQNVLGDFKVEGEIVSIYPGPVVTLYELEPAPGTKSSKVISISDDIARSMSAVSVRCAVVPGRNVIGIELPNKKRQYVYQQELITSALYQNTKAALPLILGKDIGGQPVLADLAKMPHLLVAGTTGSGKSVAVNSMILSLLYRLSPEQCRFIMIDPKMLELSVYDGIPHLLAPVVTEPGKAVVALKWTVAEMENRYRAMSKLGVRNIDGYNERVKEAAKNGETITTRVKTGFDPETGKPIYEDQEMDLTPLPYIVVIVDEFADLMLVAGKDVEAAIQRLAQMARAAGIHLIMATQRPSVDVITGVIKANFPTRISFAVTSKIDSRTILGEGGAEQLLGMGDMLYMAPGGRITRVHGPFVSDDDVEQVVSFLKSQGDPLYIDDITDGDGIEASEIMAAIFEGRTGGEYGEGVDELYDQAVALVAREGKASTSFVQRYLQIGYNRAARIIEEMERQGVVSQATKTGKREVLIRDVSDY